jgi:hypothetical protein
MPEEIYDRMFPLEIVPPPDEVVRAALVFDTLDGAKARAQWLPGLAATLRSTGENLASEEFATRAKAQAAFRAVGDLSLEILSEFSRSDDPEVRGAARELAAEIEAGPGLGINKLRPSKENATGLVERLWPPSEQLEGPQED